MKRPSGFDRSSEPRRPEPESRRERPGEQEESPARSFFTMRGRRGDAAVPPSGLASPAERSGPLEPSGPVEPAEPGGTPERAGPLAETIDLSEVRRERATDAEREAPDLGAPGPEIGAHEDGTGGEESGAPEGEPGAAVAPRGGASLLDRLRAPRDADPVREAERRLREASRNLKKREQRERRRFSADARRRRRYWLVAGATVAALALFVIVGVFTPLMSVRKVEVAGAATVNVEEVQQALARFDGTPLALVADADVHRALEPFPLIQRYAVERIPPDTLRVQIEERVPVVTIGSDGAFQQYDAAGVPVGAVDAPQPGVPLAAGSIADLSSDAFRAATRALRDMPAELRAQIASVTASSGQDVTLNLSNGIEVMWGGPEDTKRKAVVLTTMLASLGGTPVEHIDVSSSEAPVFR